MVLFRVSLGAYIAYHMCKAPLVLVLCQGIGTAKCNLLTKYLIIVV